MDFYFIFSLIFFLQAIARLQFDGFIVGIHFWSHRGSGILAPEEGAAGFFPDMLFM